MAIGTPISKITETIEQVEIMQGQLRGLAEALDLLAKRVVALEQGAGATRKRP